jgi:hypothetical protein
VVIVLSESTVFIRHPLKCCLVLPKDLSLGYAYLFITLFSVQLSPQNIFCLLHYQNCPFHKLCNWQYTSAIWHWFHSQSVCCWLNTDEVRGTILITYCLNPSKCQNSYVLWPTLCLPLIVPYCYITPQLVPSNNISHLSAVTLWLLMPVGRNTSNRSLQLCASIAFFILFFTAIFMHLASKVAYCIIQEASPWHPFYIHAFIGSNFCPSLIDNISLRILCHNIRNFILFSIAGRNCHSTRHATAANLVCSDIHTHTYIYSAKK